ncbi:MAG: glycerol-3-phosphate 1-O-acyltransferase PlsY [Gemmatimonadetes bacterium]|nr:glycerol-3-phosphate 1-O-acyltransferase PlsY [Gemmatimonadota bacterium]
MNPALAVLIAYVAGSFPSAYLAGRALKGIDLRTVGSGNLGATNVYRTLGAGAASVVLLIDALKGALPAALLPAMIDPSYRSGPNATLWWGLACGVAAIAGHAKPIFLLGKGGGKGVATGSGVFAALAPAAIGLAVIVFAAIVYRSRMVSLASIGGSLSLPIAVAFTLGADSPVFAASCLIALFVVWMHRANIQRIRAGTEPRLTSPTAEGTR